MRQMGANHCVVGIITASLLLGFGCKRQAQERTVTLPAGTHLLIRLGDSLDTGRNRSGDLILGQTAEAIFVGDALVVPERTTIRGSVSDIQGAARGGGRAHMTIRFTAIGIDAQPPHPTEVQPLRFVAASEVHDDQERTAAVGPLSGFLGAVMVGAGPTAVGDASQLGPGTAVVLATKRGEIHLAPGQEVVVRLERSVELPLQPVSAGEGPDRGTAPSRSSLIAGQGCRRQEV